VGYFGHILNNILGDVGRFLKTTCRITSGDPEKRRPGRAVGTETSQADGAIGKVVCVVEVLGHAIISPCQKLEDQMILPPEKGLPKGKKPRRHLAKKRRPLAKKEWEFKRVWHLKGENPRANAWENAGKTRLL